MSYIAIPGNNENIFLIILTFEDQCACKVFLRCESVMSLQDGEKGNNETFLLSHHLGISAQIIIKNDPNQTRERYTHYS